MLLAEPPSTQYDLHFEILGIPIRVHPFFWLAGLILGARGDGGMALLIWMMVFFVSILVHELGHSLMMRRFGISSHIVLYMMGGLAVPDSMGSGRRADRPGDSIMISFAGPAAGFMLAALVVVFIIGTGGLFQLTSHFPFFAFDLNTPPDMNQTPLFLLTANLLWINIFWGLINLVPVFPLDGGQIARTLLSVRDPWKGMTQSLWVSVYAGGAMALMGFMLQSLFMAILFGMLAVQSYFAIKQVGGGGFGGGGFGTGGRPW